MEIIRVEKTKNYTVMSNQHLRDQALSLSARGLMSMMLSLPDDWDFSIAGLSTLCKEGAQVIRRCLAEMEKAGYLTRKRVNSGNGHFAYEYTLTEYPATACASPCNGKPHTALPHTVEPHTVEPCAVDFTQINTDKQNTDKRNTDIQSTDKTNRHPTVSEKAFEAEFESIWETYPRKVGKKKALAAYIRARKKGVEAETVIDGVKRYNASIAAKGTPTQYIKQGATWFDGACWDDDYTDNCNQQRKPYSGQPHAPQIRPEDYNGDDVPW